jgi:glycosyltransferase involved in cell wall biosynthesis
MKSARVLIFPSVWYEGAPITIVEAFACGLPVIASDLGAMRELIDHGRTGLLFQPHDYEDLVRQIKRILDRPGELLSMREAARMRFQERFTAERNYEWLMEIYEGAIERARVMRAAS